MARNNYFADRGGIRQPHRVYRFALSLRALRREARCHGSIIAVIAFHGIIVIAVQGSIAAATQECWAAVIFSRTIL